MMDGVVYFNKKKLSEQFYQLITNMAKSPEHLTTHLAWGAIITTDTTLAAACPEECCFGKYYGALLGHRAAPWILWTQNIPLFLAFLLITSNICWCQSETQFSKY